MAFILAPRQAHELPHAIALLDRLPGIPKWVVADRGYATYYDAPTRAADDTALVEASGGLTGRVKA